MLKRLELKNCFKHADRVIDFTTGLTAIIGPNESGKSLIFEMISYALFGSVALRGASEDYKKLQVALDFSVAGKPYRVTRAGSKCLLYVDGHELATGTKVVNPKIVEILGYDYKVFSIANCANQDELTKLGNMKPTERKQMVDNVIGLTIIDDLNKFVTTKISELNIQVETMRVNVVAPEAPVKPDNYREAGVLQKAINDLTISEQRYNYLRQWLTIMRNQPVLPIDPGFGDVQKLISDGNAQAVKFARKRELEQQLARYTEPTSTAEQIAQQKALWEKADQLSDLKHKLTRFAPAPAYSKAQLDEWAQAAEQYSLWQQKEKLLGQGENECPACHHHWPVAAAELEKFKDVEACAMPPYVPTLRDYSAIDTYTAESASRIQLEDQVKAFGILEAPTMTKDQIALQERSLADFEGMVAAKQELAALNTEFATTPPDYNSMIQRQQIYLQQLAAYNQGVTEYNQWVEEFGRNKTECESLQEIPAQVQILRDLMVKVAFYDHQCNQYQRAIETYNTQLATIESKSVQLNQYERVRIALKEARSTVKKYLVPSLNRVASALLSQMTGGARSHIEISEDFEITVDGQPLNTLSGSGKAVANLAIRIALGQVLIAKKFPIFMADEIDGSMDADRAEFTSECLRRLTKHVPQLLLISHKRPEADHYIELGR